MLRRPVVVGVIGFAGVLLIGGLDVLTGSELAFSLFYVLPILLVAWSVGARGAIPLAVVAALVWRLADALAGATYSASWIPVWNTGMRLGFFLITGGLMANLRTTHIVQSRMARTDGLTGLANSRSFMSDVEAEVARSLRFGHPIALAYIDLDDFKTINDTLGHGGGDEVLKGVASVLRAATRSTDRVGRLGGDEFAVLLTETAQSGALAAVRKLQHALVEDGTIGVSIGLVTCQRAPGSAESLISAADAAMYEAKRRGKGQFSHHHLSPVPDEDRGADPPDPVA